MSIEFHCSECYAKVITPDETGGKQGKCPYCTAIIHIPERNPAAVVPQPVQTNPVVAPHSQPVIQQGQPVPQQGPAPPSTLNDPFKPTGDKTAQPKDVLVEKQLGLDRWEEKLGDGTWGEDTTLSFKMRKMVAQEHAKNRLVGPSQGLIVVAAINLIAVAIGIIGLMVYILYHSQYQFEPDVFYVILSAVVLSIHMMASAMIMIGGNNMKFTRSYGMAYTGAIFAVLPLNLLFPVTIPFGIWAIVTLNQPAVGEGFKRH
jgi:DNA-directed RNA polymerase subunit RPC12/RpoP